MLKQEKNRILGKWLWILFWLIIPSTLSGILSNETVTAGVPWLTFAGRFLGLAVSMSYGFLLLQLSAAEEDYHKSGICCLISALLSVASLYVGHLMGEGRWIQLLTIPGVAVSITGEFFEYRAHRKVLSDVHPILSEKWEKLWKWYVISIICSAASVLLLPIIPALGMGSFLFGSLTAIVVDVMKLIYLYRSAVTFRENVRKSSEN